MQMMMIIIIIIISCNISRVIHTTLQIGSALTYPSYNMPASISLLLLPSAYTTDQTYKEGCLNITTALNSGNTVNKLGRNYCKGEGYG
jgi:hypothetical protein